KFISILCYISFVGNDRGQTFPVSLHKVGTHLMFWGCRWATRCQEWDSALVVGLTCRVGCSTRADQRVLSALVVRLTCRVGCSTRADQRVLSALVVGLTCRVGCSTR
ncbi:unnamed protein product, partial [Staurois parvus]